MAKTRLSAIEPATFEHMVASWLTPLGHGDMSVVMSYPASDRQRRLLNLLDDKILQDQYLGIEKRLWISVDFRVDPIEDTLDLERCIEKKITESSRIPFPKKSSFHERLYLWQSRSKTRLYFIGMGAEALLKSRNTQLLIWFTIAQRMKSLRMLLFFESNLMSRESLDLFSAVPAFQPRMSTMSLYDEKNSYQFIEYKSKDWDMHLDEKIIQELIETCGGVLLFLKEALWYLRDHPNAGTEGVWGHQEMRFSLGSFWNRFSSDERRVLDGIVQGADISIGKDSSILDYLLETKVIARKNDRFQITVPLLTRYRKDQLFSKNTLECTQDSILLNGIPVNREFSKSERRLLRFFMLHVGDEVSRDQVAEVLWKEKSNEKYSDWAIDSHVSRLRRRFVRLGIGEKSLRTLKNKGFIFSHYGGNYD